MSSKTVGVSSIPKSLGDHTIELLQITSHNGNVLDLSKSFEQLIISEDMMMSSISVDLYINDTEEIISNLPIIGQERVIIKYKSAFSNRYIYLELWVYMISEVETTRHQLNYKLSLVTSDLVKNYEYKISRYFSNDAASIALKIFEEFNASKSLIISKSDDRQKLIIPNIAPFAAIRWLSTLAYKSGSTAYVFFENNRNYVFKPIEELFYPEKKGEYNIKEIDPTNLMTSITAIDTWKIISNFDVLGNIMGGMYNSTNISCDILSRQVSKSTHSYWKNSEQYIESRGGESANNPLLDKSNISKSKGLQHNPEIISYTPYNKYNSYNRSENILSREYGLQLFDNFKIELSVFGDTNIAVGDVIGIDLPLFKETTSKESYANPSYYGKWLIIKLTHKISSMGYYMKITAVKDRTAVTFPKLRS